MSDKYFIDTNIFVYSFSPSDMRRRKRAESIIENALKSRRGCISFQVIQEFVNVATRKFPIPLSIPDCGRYLKDVLSPLCEVFSSVELYEQALDLMERWRFSYYDSLIVASALRADCDILYSEDFQDSQKIFELTVRDPFK